MKGDSRSESEVDINYAAVRAVVDRAVFRAELDALRVREKGHTRDGDAIAASRRRLPMVEVDRAARLVGPHGPVTPLDAFEGRRQLIAELERKQLKGAEMAGARARLRSGSFVSRARSRRIRGSGRARSGLSRQPDHRNPVQDGRSGSAAAPPAASTGLQTMSAIRRSPEAVRPTISS